VGESSYEQSLADLRCFWLKEVSGKKVSGRKSVEGSQWKKGSGRVSGRKPDGQASSDDLGKGIAPLAP
jgi:hypothetical protein